MCNDNGVDLLVELIEHLAIVREALRVGVLRQRLRDVSVARVHVADGHHVLMSQRFEVLPSLQPNPDECDVDLVVS